MPTVESRQSGSVQMNLTDTTKNVTITSVNLTKSIVIIQMGGAGAAIYTASTYCARAKLTSSTNLQINRNMANPALDIYWQVIEFSSGVSIQQGTASLSSSSVNVTVTSTDLNKSWSLCTAEGNFSVTHTDSLVEHMLTTSTNLNLQTSGSGSGHQADWQVIEMDDATVQSFNGTVSGTYQDITITSVTTAEAFVSVSYSKNGSNLVDGDELKGARLYSSTAVRLSAYASDTQNYSLYVIEDSNISVQRGWDAISGTGVNKTISSVTQSKCMLKNGGQYQCWNTWNNYYNENIQEFSTWITFDSSTQISVDRDVGSYSITSSWEVVEFEDVAVSRRIFITS
ncbi:MAG TPA: hypothetical protein EYP60_04340 [bacterium (Candidatus Stahlbacteria)]|nr:hypothetical protein [Candidatus Stahlbacteria bacterium]